MEQLLVDPLCQENEEDALSNEEVVAKIMDFAKLDSSQIRPNVEQLFFSPTLASDSIKLLELNNQTLACLEAGDSLVFKGEGSENIVLCTDKETFEVKDTEISNSLLIVPKLWFDGCTENISRSKTETNGDEALVTNHSLNLRIVHIDAVSHSYLELKPIKPKLHKILDLLEPSAYKGPECEELVTADKIHRNELEQRVLASNEEIDLALSRLTVVEIDGYVRLIDFDYLSRVIVSITAFLEENSLHFDDFSATEVIAGLKDLYPEVVVENVLQHFALSKTVEADAKWSLDEDKVGYRS